MRILCHRIRAKTALILPRELVLTTRRSVPGEPPYETLAYDIRFKDRPILQRYTRPEFPEACVLPVFDLVTTELPLSPRQMLRTTDQDFISGESLSDDESEHEATDEPVTTRELSLRMTRAGTRPVKTLEEGLEGQTCVNKRKS
jgi:hypothetical protein